MAFDQFILTHPDNLSELAKAVNGDGMLEAARGAIAVGLAAIPVRTDRNLAKRKIEETWHPPAAERFVEYGPEDETWLRPLRIGRFEYVDRGPLVWFIDFTPLRQARWEFTI